MKLSTVLVILCIAFFVLALLMVNNIYANRQIQTPEGDEPVDLTPVWITLAISIGLLIGSILAYVLTPADNRAPPYMGQQVDSDPGEIRTLDKSGEVKRVGGGKW